MNINRLKTTVFLLLLSSILLTSCSGKGKTISESGFYFDTVITITLYDESLQKELSHCMEMASEYEKLFSATMEDSDISKINAIPRRAVHVNPETLELISLGLYYGKLSEGRFDITIGKLADLWAFEKAIVPDDKAINHIRSHVDYRKISIKDDTVLLKDPDASIDLGGIAKGYIADKIKEYLKGEGIEQGLINLGGNVLTLGEKPDKKPYCIGIQKPFSNDGSPIVSVETVNKSVVTSGNYQRYFKADGHIYHHILDKTTGYPCENGLNSVTIISDSSAEGDALSTSVFLMGLSKGKEFVESRKDLDAVFITTDNEVIFTSGFDERINYKLY